MQKEPSGEGPADAPWRDALGGSTPRYVPLSPAQFVLLTRRLRPTRNVTGIHLHYTIRPCITAWAAAASMQNMLQCQHRLGFGVSCQHLTIDPQGNVWTGRNWDLPPVSVAGQNGDADAGPLAIALIGDFGDRQETPTDAQREALVIVLAAVLEAFKLQSFELDEHHIHWAPALLPPAAGLTVKCPIEFGELREDVRMARGQIADSTGSSTSSKDEPLPGAVGQDQRVVEALDAVGDAAPAAGSKAVDATFPHYAIDPAEGKWVPEATSVALPPASTTAVAASTAVRRGSRDTPVPITPQLLDAVRNHVVDLTAGQFSTGGKVRTTSDDVDQIFLTHLPAWWNDQPDKTKPLRIVLFAHGGLVPEEDGLRVAYKHVNWWKKNNVYPIYFTWETGFWQTVGELIGRALPRGLTRDFFDYTTDPTVELVARSIGGVKVWGGMKLSAELAFGEEGGGAYTVARLMEFLQNFKGAPKIEVHGVGHSAGSIFLSRLVDHTTPAGRVPLETVQFLAPAVTAADFRKLLLPQLGGTVKDLTLYTMRKDLERADSVTAAYHKSLLYLIYYALEPKGHEPILGLKESILAAADLKKVFGLDGGLANNARVVWSTTEDGPIDSRSMSKSHGAFDDDAPTMNSVAARVTGTAPKQAYVTNQTGEGIADRYLPPAVHVQAQPIPDPALAMTDGGRRMALCVGIDRYPRNPLSGCVNDAGNWAALFEGLGFKVQSLHDDRATYDQIVASLTALIVTAKPGDVIAFQYAGHGTSVEDLNGDEINGDTPGWDEAVVPFDYDTGKFLIDDDLAVIFDKIPPGVNVTCFMDCCHSGSINRLGFGPGMPTEVGDSRPRFIVPDEAMSAAHRAYRETVNHSETASPRIGSDAVGREVLFAACLSHEVAWESDGHGDFTTRAMTLLGQGLGGLTNRAFQDRIREEFGDTPRQHPELMCDPSGIERGLLQPLADGAAAPVRQTSSAGSSSLMTMDERSQLIATIRDLVSKL